MANLIKCLIDSIGLKLRYTASLLLLTLRCFAQSQGTAFHHLTLESGLSQGNTEHFFQDSRGFVWMGTMSGLNRYDGQRIRTYQPDPNDRRSIRGNNIQSQIFEDKEGNLWFSTFEAINCYIRKDDAFRHYTLKDEHGEPISGYYFAGIEHSGTLWVVVQPNHLYTLDAHTGQFSFVGETALGTTSVQLYLAPTGKAQYLLTHSYDKPGIQINTLTNGVLAPPKRFLEGKNGEPAWIVQRAAIDQDSIVWFAAGKRGLGRCHLNTGKCEMFQTPTASVVNDLALSDRPYLWVTTADNGLWRFDRKSEQFVGHWKHDPSDKYSLGGDKLSRIYGDQNDNLWIDVTNVGVDFFQPKNIRFRSFPDKKNTLEGAKPALGALLETPDGCIFGCVDSKAVYLFDGEGNVMERIENEPGKPPKLPSFPMRLVCDAKGRVWVLAWYGLGIWEPVRHQFQIVSSQGFIAGCLLRNGTLLIASSKGGVFALHEKRPGQFDLEPQTGIDSLIAFTSLYEDTQGRLWGCKNAADVSVYASTNSGWKHLRDIGVHGDAKAYTEDKKRQTMWVATTEGLTEVSLKDFKTTVFTERNGLPNTTVYSALPDTEGHLWLGTNRGISRFDPSAIQFQNFGRDDGLPSFEFNSFAFIKKKDGAFWFGTQGGGIAFTPEKIHLLEIPAQPVITGILVNDLPDTTLRCARTGARNVSEIRSLDFDYQHNTLSFELAALEFSNPAHNRFRYQMLGVDAAPVEAGTRGFARYANLPPGHYTLLVWASNADGVWNPTANQLSIQIHPPFWQTTWFIALMLLLGVAIAYALYRNRIARLRHEFSLRQQAQEQELRATASELKALRAQMNPHFLFNALNSINATVLNGDKAQASAQIGQFAQLMRGTLQHSERNIVPLADELALLETYIQIEQQRFNPPFRYEIRLNPDLDPHDEPMPTMILQPFVENAIWHGLMHLPPGSGAGHILIAVEKYGQGLHCTVEDNGGGRERAATVRDQHHKSQGMGITAERLRLLPGQNRMHITDLYDPTTGEATGTRVEVWLET